MGSMCSSGGLKPGSMSTGVPRVAPNGSIKQVGEAVEHIQTLIDGLEDNLYKKQLQSNCELLQSFVKGHQSSPPSCDTLGVLQNLPESLFHNFPPSLAASASKAAAADEATGSPPPPVDEKLLAATREWGFNLHEIAFDDLPGLCYAVITQHPEVAACGIDTAKLWRYVLAVSQRYRRNAFHSFRHAVDVTICASYFVRAAQHAHAADFADPLVVAATVVAAMAHDIEHPAVMNAYLIATSHPLAVLYNGRSVLENHHSATAIAMALRPELNFLCGMAAKEADAFRKHMVTAILATDVMTHIPFKKDWEARLEQGEAMPADIIMQMILKASDISNPARSLEVYQPWIDAVMLEFFAQGDAERELGLPISMNCDRHTVKTAACQVGFISFIVAPVYSALVRWLPEEAHLAKQLDANKAHFQAA